MRKWRQAAGKTMAEVGEDIGVTKGHLSQVENGKANLSLPMFLDYCRSIDTPASRVLGDKLLPKDRDIDRLIRALVKSAGLKSVRWLAELEREDLLLALERGREAVEARRYRQRTSRSESSRKRA